MKVLRKRKSLLVLLAFVLVFALAACGNNDPAPPPADNNDNGEQAAPTLNYPTRDIRAIVPFAPGGGTDVMARNVAANINLDGRNMVIMNIEGAGSGIGSMEAYHAAGDGYTLLVHSIEAVVSNYLVGTFTIPLHERMEWVATIVSDANAVSVRADSPFQTVHDLIAYAQANPGEVLFASMGIGTAAHTGAVEFWDAANIEVNYVPYDGAAGARAAVLGGHADVLFGQVSEVKPLYVAGEMRILGILSPERQDFLPDTPTMMEQGVNVANTITRGFMVAPGTPRDVMEYLEARIYEVFIDPEFQNRLREDLGFYTQWMGIDESAAFMAGRVPIQTELARRLGLL